MKMGTGLVLATLGAILRFAVDDDWEGVDLEVVGTILLVVGAVAFFTGLALEFTKRPAIAPQPPSGRGDAAPPPAAPPPQSSTPPRPQ